MQSLRSHSRPTRSETPGFRVKESGLEIVLQVFFCFSSVLEIEPVVLQLGKKSSPKSGYF